jgi:hypothetical protein
MPGSASTPAIQPNGIAILIHAGMQATYPSGCGIAQGVPIGADGDPTKTLIMDIDLMW